MSLGGFNLTTHKKEDVTVRSKVQEIKRAKYETRKLETEGKKMEERLMELKMAMNREKEERERQGGGFWKSGQQGSLHTFPEEVLAKKKNKSAGKIKVKVLKDKPLDVPERSHQPGTMAFIAQRGAHTPRDKPKGPRCGQCEEKGAAVSCVQCAEDYCAGCFAAFHLKGNLKKHRSVPLAATPRQCFASPRPHPSQTSSSIDYGYGDGAVMGYEQHSARRKDRNSPEGASGTYEGGNNHLLTGDYNEAEQAASFQEALKAWRQGEPGTGDDSRDVRKSYSGGNTGRTPRGVPYSPVQTPTVNVDTATGTVQAQQDIEIKFNTSTVSYADRLLLKKHRRTDVDALFTPREAEQPSTRESSARKPSASRKSPRPKSRGVRREKSNISLKFEDFDENDFAVEDDERVDFQALYNAVKTAEGDTGVTTATDNFSIVEVQESVSNQSIEQSKTYKVQEEGQAELWSTEERKRSKTKDNIEVKPPTSAKSSRRKSGKKLRQSSEFSTQPKPVESARKETMKKVERDDSYVLGATLNDITNEFKREKSKSDRLNVASFPSVTDEGGEHSSSEQSPPIISARENVQSPLHSARPPRLQSAKSRPQSGKTARPLTGRANSRQGSRPGSRTGSRMGSRAASRLENPGLLTKAPSDALSQIARMTPTSDPYKGLDSFYMVGVEPGEPPEGEERTLTPTQHKKGKDEKIKVSYQLYNMAPKSWKPDFSLADAVDTDTVEQEEAEEDRASSVMAFHAISEQLVSDITERLISRFGELPLDDDSLSDHSSGGAHRSLGEEYRTMSRSHSSSLHDSPIISGRGTPVHMFNPASRSQTTRDPSHLAAQTPRKSTTQDPRKSTQDPPIQSARKSASQRPPQSQTPRQQQPQRSRAQTPRASASKREVPTPRRSKTYHEQMERPESRAVVMDGKDLSMYDDVGEKDKRNEEDEETLDQLEWELASQSGRLTADGKVSRMELLELMSDSDSLDDSMDTFRSISRLGQDKGYDINTDGKVSRMELLEPMSDSDSLDDSMDTFRSISRLGQDKGYDINSRLRKEELEEDHDGMSGDDEEDNVRNLM